MILGFTGTRQGATDAQIVHLRLQFARLKPERFIHGGAIGADEQAHQEAIKFMVTRNIEIYPGEHTRQFYWDNKYPRPLVFPWAQPLIRNKRIVGYCNALIALPATEEEQQRSGTWMTIRYAKKRHLPCLIVYPSGICHHLNGFPN